MLHDEVIKKLDEIKNHFLDKIQGQEFYSDYPIDDMLFIDDLAKIMDDFRVRLLDYSEKWESALPICKKECPFCCFIRKQ